MSNLHTYITTEQSIYWNLYLDFSTKGIKSEAKEMLHRFIDSIKKELPEKIDLIALELLNLKERNLINIQFPLFKEILLPTLIKNAKENKPGFFRAIAEFEQFFYSDFRLSEYLSNELSIDTKSFDTIKFCEKELTINPNDSKAAELLISKLAQGLDFAVHELPDGFCWEFEYFTKILDKFIHLLNKYGFLSEWENRIIFLNTIKNNWEDFLMQKEISTYKEFYELKIEKQ